MKYKVLTLLTSLAFIGCSTTSQQMPQKHLTEGVGKPKQFWWPNQVNLSPLRQHSVESNPMGEKFNYAQEFKKLNLKAIKKDIVKIMKTSQDFWPADYGHYGPFFIRMAWHSSGTYRVFDGRGGAAGGQQRFEPLNSWPDNANLDKARRLLWPIKKKYGRKISWADLMVLAGNVALEDMGFKTFGFAGGRSDDWEADLVYWGPEEKFLARKRHSKKGKLKRPFGATQMGLIYVNPEGPKGKPDPLLAAKAIREAFKNMAMNDEETVALIAGGHTFGKAHGAKKPDECLGPEPAAAQLENQGLGWKNKCEKGTGENITTSGLEGAWTSTPTQWSMQYLQFLYAFKWKQTKSPAGAIQWVPAEESTKNLVPDAFDKNKRHKPIMFTTDIALKHDPLYNKIAKSFLENPKKFEDAFARAWFKLTHRDMGPHTRYVGKDAPKEVLSWQDPIPKRNYRLINGYDIKKLKRNILKSNLSISELVKTAWAAASSFRSTDMRGGANGARIRLLPQKNWEVNDPKKLTRTLKKLKQIQKDFNKTLRVGKKVSLSDVIILAGATAIEKAAKNAGVSIKVPFKAGRVDTSQDHTNIKSFSYLEPKADGFRNYYSKKAPFSPIVSLIDKANMLNLTVPEMTVLIGGLRVLNINTNNSSHGVFTHKKDQLTADFFINLFDMNTKWVKSSSENLYEGRDRKTQKLKWTATPVDLVFGSNSELRAIGEVYGANDGKKKFVKDFVKAWTKVMRLDRFDLKK